MKARAAFAKLVAANPVPERRIETLVDRESRIALLGRVTASGVPPTSRRRSTRSRERIAAAVFAAIIVGAAPAYAVGRSLVDWLAAESAPPDVVSDFGRYAPQLGFDPDPGKAVLVAEDRDVRLFATTNQRGTYCFILSTRADGGTCVSREVASSPVVAGYVSNVPLGGDTRLLVVVGRIKDPEARAVSFTTPDGGSVTRGLGAGGFFVAGIRASGAGSVCDNGDWEPSFTFFNNTGDVKSRYTITLAKARGAGVCVSGFFEPPA